MRWERLQEEESRTHKGVQTWNKQWCMIAVLSMKKRGKSETFWRWNSDFSGVLLSHTAHTAQPYTVAPTPNTYSSYPGETKHPIWVKNFVLLHLKLFELDTVSLDFLSLISPQRITHSKHSKLVGCSGDIYITPTLF